MDASPGAIRPLAFPGGIADRALRHAALQDHRGHVVVLALSDGRLLWRSAEPVRALLLLDDELLVLNPAAPPHCEALALVGNPDGRAGWRSTVLPLPSTGSAQGSAALELDVDVEWLDGEIRLHWCTRGRYTGGAPPGHEVLRAAKRQQQGCLRIDRDSGRVQADPGPPDSAAALPLEIPDSADPQLLAERRFGTRRYRLFARNDSDGMVHTVLAAVDAASGAAQWSVSVDTVPLRPPAARRP